MKTHKTCTLCDGLKPLEDFNIARKNRDGRQTYCRICARKHQKEYSATIKKRNATAEHDQLQEKKCTGCHQLKPLSKFHKAYSLKDGHHSECKTCALERARKGRATSTYMQTYRAHNRDKLLAQRAAVDKKLRDDGFTGPTQVLGLRWIHKNDRAAECEICCATECPNNRIMSLDHDHTTNGPRGFLCHLCNTGLAAFDGRPELVNKAIGYLSRTLAKPVQWRLTQRLGRFPSYNNLPPVAKREAVAAWKKEIGGCEICGTTEGRMCRDHDHRTGAYRGILCMNCNQCIGRFCDRLVLLTRAKAYLIRTSDSVHQRTLFERLRAPYTEWKRRNASDTDIAHRLALAA